MAFPGSLRNQGIFWVLSAVLAGVAATWVWMASQSAWQAHLTRAFLTGLELHASLKDGAAVPAGVTITEILDAPPKGQGGYVTLVSILESEAVALSGQRLALHILSPDLRYPVTEIASDGGASPASRLANITRVLASFCSEPLVFAQLGDAPWLRIDGRSVWGCEAAPRDLRLYAGLGLGLVLVVLLSQVGETARRFRSFADALRGRHRIGAPDTYRSDGPDELRDTVDAVNTYLTQQRDILEKRAAVLSGISHDLGTPATRLRLRTALIQDDVLREKFDSDIDRMTGMIESVLTYTQSEMNAEVPRNISLTSLVEAVVDDYTDLDQPVEMVAAKTTEIDAGHSLFGADSGQVHVSFEEKRRVLVTAQPVALRRAISNLIDNALKYGRRARVAVEADSETARILVADEGKGMSEGDLVDLTAPFKRGPNSENIAGFGLGLAIVSTIAEQHGGTLRFEERGDGLTAVLTIARR